jgi:hypothetical protein
MKMDGDSLRQLFQQRLHDLKKQEGLKDEFTTFNDACIDELEHQELEEIACYEEGLERSEKGLASEKDGLAPYEINEYDGETLTDSDSFY